MADKIFYDVQALQPNLKTVAGSFTTAGSSDPSVTTGTGYTVAHTSTGKWTVTLGDKYPGILSGSVTIQSSAAADLIVQLGDIDTTSAKTVVIFLWDISAAAVADATGPIIHFTLNLRNTSLTS